MKKIFAVSVMCLMFAPSAFSAVPWWEQPTVCKLDPTDCYSTMGAGYDGEAWDSETGCWGMKYICPEALKTPGSYQPVLMGRQEIANGGKINIDYDTNILNGDCFGVRKTTDNGAMASVNGEYVRVWCNGVLDNPDPDNYLPNGELPENGREPTCSELARNGFMATQAGKCFGKYYDPMKYTIECGDPNSIFATNILELNGADPSYTYANAPTTADDADDIFDRMQEKSASQRKIYFQDD